MKRLFFCAGFVLTILFTSGCAQHDTKSPDTSGAVPYTDPGVGVDTTTRTNAGTGAPNNNNDGTNNNQQVNTGDSTSNKQ